MEHKKIYQWIAVLAVAIVVIGLIAQHLTKTPVTSVPAPAISGGESASPTSTSAAQGGNSVSVPARPSGTMIKIALISPAAGDRWITGKQNTIQWKPAAGAPDGTITLRNASTGATVGWIQQHLLPQQTVFPWNTGVISMNQTSPLTENVPPGNYQIVLTFNSPSVPAVAGPVFSIIAAAEAQIPTATVIIQGASFSPASITLTQGTQLTIINHDARSYGLTVSSRALPFTIGTSTSLLFDTSILSPGDYVFYSTTFPLLRLAITTK